MRNALLAPGANVTLLRLRPRVGEIFVDFRRQVYYRILGVSPQGKLRPALVAHNQIVHLLETWAEEIQVAVGEITIPCVCPAHLGILGSGLAFTLDAHICPRPDGWVPDEKAVWPAAQVRSLWRILLDVRRERFYGETNISERIEYRSNVHGWPLRMDLGLWGEGQGRPGLEVPREAYFSANDATAFFRPQEGDEDVEAEKAGPNTYFDPTDQGYVLRHDLGDTQTKRLTQVNMPTATTTSNYAFSTCWSYCSMLEKHLWTLAGLATK